MFRRNGGQMLPAPCTPTHPSMAVAATSFWQTQLSNQNPPHTHTHTLLFIWLLPILDSFSVLLQTFLTRHSTARQIFCLSRNGLAMHSSLGGELKRPVSSADYNFHCIPGAKSGAETEENSDANWMAERWQREPRCLTQCEERKYTVEVTGRSDGGRPHCCS